MSCTGTSVCRVLMLKAHSRLMGDAIVANPQSQERNNPAKEAKEEKNLPTDKDYSVSLLSGPV